jgi:hypothetical protein
MITDSCAGARVDFHPGVARVRLSEACRARLCFQEFDDGVHGGACTQNTDRRTHTHTHTHTLTHTHTHTHTLTHSHTHTPTHPHTHLQHHHSHRTCSCLHDERCLCSSNLHVKFRLFRISKRIRTDSLLPLAFCARVRCGSSLADGTPRPASSLNTCFNQSYAVLSRVHRAEPAGCGDVQQGSGGSSRGRCARPRRVRLPLIFLFLSPSFHHCAHCAVTIFCGTAGQRWPNADCLGYGWPRLTIASKDGAWLFDQTCCH